MTGTRARINSAATLTAIFVGVMVVVACGPESAHYGITPYVLIASLAVVSLALLIRSRTRKAMERRRRDQAIADAVHQDRLSLTEHLHHIISNRIASIAAQASACLLADESDPRVALRTIEADSRAAAREMRRLLALLQSSTHVPVPTAPLQQIYAQASASGVSLAVKHTTAFRSRKAEEAASLVVHESLMNVLRHAGGAPTEVIISRENENIRIIIRNETPEPAPPASPGAGIGLLLLQKKCNSLGGSISSGETSNGYIVDAVIPDPQDD